jgi:GNAT superfamily N-acetyltransferase
MGLPAGFTVRAAAADDLEAVAAVFAADDIDDVGEVVLDADFIGSAWSRSGFDLATDAWVVVDGAGTIVGYAHAMRDGPDVVDSWGLVHPAQRGQGLGPALLGRIEERAGQLLAGVPDAKFRQSVNAGDRAAAAMLQARGLRLVRHFWHMGIDLDGPVPAGDTPDGIEIAGVDPLQDLPTMHAVLIEAFADDWGYHPDPFDEWADDYAGSPNYDPTLWLLALDGTEPVAVLVAQVYGEIGVLKSHRGRGIADALLRHSFATFAERGFGRLMLNVDAENPTGATALYERVGMRIIKRWDLWERSQPDAG